MFILGGGVSKNPDKFIPFLTVRVPVVPAQLRNDAGIIGSAMFAAERAVAGNLPSGRTNETGATQPGTLGTTRRSEADAATGLPADPA